MQVERLTVADVVIGKVAKLSTSVRIGLWQYRKKFQLESSPKRVVT